MNGRGLWAKWIHSPPPAPKPFTVSWSDFLFPASLKRWNRSCWMMDRCAGFVLLCSALKEIIDLHYRPPRKTQAFIHTHPIQLFHPHDYITSHMAAGLLINRRMFISLPVFYRGGVLSLATGTASPGLTREGKLSRRNTGFTSLLRWCQKRALHHRDETLHLHAWNEGYSPRLNLSGCHGWLMCWLK